MGKIVIVLEDGPGGIAVKAALDPKPAGGEPTMAQKLGLFLVTIVQRAAEDMGGKVLEGLDARVHMAEIGTKIEEPKPVGKREPLRRGFRPRRS